MHRKILFIYSDDKDSEEFKTESLWAEKIGNKYKVDNIPFFIKNIAVGDIINVEHDEEDEAFYFDELVETSGNSVVRIVLFDNSPDEREKVGKELLELGCDWESLENGNLIAVHIPKEASYDNLKRYLESNKKRLDYQEACLGFKN